MSDREIAALGTAFGAGLMLLCFGLWSHSEQMLAWGGFASAIAGFLLFLELT
jgi:hypothetical protein